MANTAQSQAVGAANEVGALCVLLNQFLSRAVAITYLPNPGALWAAMPTAALNADGSLGAPDIAPDVTHPVDVRVVPGLNRAASEAQYVAAMTLIQTLISTQATPTNAAILAPFLGT